MFESLKNYIPSISKITNAFSNTSKSITNMVSTITLNETEYLYKAEYTEKEILTYLSSKMEMEIIYALKIIIINIQNKKDISIYIPRVLDIYVIYKEYYIKSLCLEIIDNITLINRDELILLYNVIGKLSHDTEPLHRMNLLHMISTLNIQNISLDVFKSLIQFINDSNPLIKRLTLVIIVKYIKIHPDYLSVEEMNDILKKYLYDSNVIVYSTFFYAICELNNSDYISFGLFNKYEEICENLINFDDFYYERTIYVLINFVNVYLKNNINSESNNNFIKILFNNLYQCLKEETYLLKNISTLIGLIQLIEFIKINKNLCDDLLKIKKEKNRLFKITNFIIKSYLQCDNNNTKLIILNIIYNIINNIKENLYFNQIKNYLSNKYNYFYLSNINDSIDVMKKKLLILINLINLENIKNILNEFKRELNFPNKIIKIEIINSLYNLCLINKKEEKIIEITIEKLIEFLKIKDSILINNIILILSKLINSITNRKNYILNYSIKNYSKNITSPYALANIINMLGNYINIIPTVIIDFYRRLCIGIEKEIKEIKMEILYLSLKIYNKLEEIVVCYKDNESDMKKKIELMIKYCINKLIVDEDVNVKEKAKMVKFFIDNKIELKEIEKKINEDDINNNNNNDNLITNQFLEVLNKNENENENKKFLFDKLNEDLLENMKIISIDQLMNKVNNDINKDNELKKKSENDDNSKYSSIKNDTDNKINNQISNINSNINIEEKKKEMKNQLDEFLNSNDDDENDDEIQIIKKQY